MAGPSNIRETNLNRRAEGMFVGGATPTDVYRALVEVPNIVGAASYQKLSDQIEALDLTDEDDHDARRTVVHYAMERAVFPSMDDSFALRYLRDIRKTFKMKLPDSMLKTLASGKGPAVLETVHHWGVFSLLFEATTLIKEGAARFDRIILFHNRSDVDPRLIELENQYLAQLDIDLILICVGSPLFRHFRQLVTDNTLFICMGDMPKDQGAASQSAATSSSQLTLLDGRGGERVMEALSMGSRLARMFKAAHFLMDYPASDRVEFHQNNGTVKLRILAKDWVFWPEL